MMNKIEQTQSKKCPIVKLKSWITYLQSLIDFRPKIKKILEQDENLGSYLQREFPEWKSVQEFWKNITNNNHQGAIKILKGLPAPLQERTFPIAQSWRQSQITKGIMENWTLIKTCFSEAVEEISAEGWTGLSHNQLQVFQRGIFNAFEEKIQRAGLREPCEHFTTISHIFPIDVNQPGKNFASTIISGMNTAVVEFIGTFSYEMGSYDNWPKPMEKRWERNIPTVYLQATLPLSFLNLSNPTGLYIDVHNPRQGGKDKTLLHLSKKPERERFRFGCPAMAARVDIKGDIEQILLEGLRKYFNYKKA